MTQAIPRIPEDQRSVAPSRRRYTDAFKQQAVRLVTHERYSVSAAAEAVGISDKTLRNWVNQATPAPEPCGEGASVEQLQAENGRTHRCRFRTKAEARRSPVRCGST